MFELSKKYQIDRRILKCDYIRYSPSEKSTINTHDSQKYNVVHRDNSVISLLTSYLELNFHILQAANDNRYVDVDDVRLINLAAIALFGENKLTTSSGNHLESTDHAHIVPLMYKLLSSSRRSDDLSIGFDRNRDRRKRKLNNNKKIEDKFILRVFFKDVFGFGEHQKTATYGLGYKVTLKRNTNNAVINKDNATNEAKVKINSLSCYVPHYSPSLEEYIKLLNQITRRIPTQLHYPEKSVFKKQVITQKN